MDMRELLERAGFGLRGPRRADCAHCTGRSRGTVSYTREVAYCHRCRWTASRRRLARELDPAAVRAARSLVTRRNAQTRSLERELAEFDDWRRNTLRAIYARLERMQRVARTACAVLRREPESQAAWEALARATQEEAQLFMALDFFECARHSAWLEQDSTLADVFQAWRELSRARPAADRPAR
jgi:hypothetical protein